MSGFQTTVNSQQAPAVKGDFASANPRHSMIALGLEAALSAGATGAIVGNFAFAAIVTGVVTSAHPGVLSKIGFVNRSGNVGLITTAYPPGEESLVIPQGQMITLFDGGDFWGLFAGGATVGQKVYASYLDGSLTAAATATPATIAVTASFATSVMTVTATAGVLGAGMPVSSAGVAAGTYITAQLTGAAGSTGTYSLSSTPGTIASQAATVTSTLETSFYVDSAAGNGELAIISTRS